ncbi:hypothetical protein C0Q70_19805 [Pomacea canaliculata]|uniref:Alpha/beta hydrolase fold-3 domain-containing protein n=1 Tax=Pomacea canaliculata TaxID=400727 RepID=A0A2T7NDR8_POMCA|nr:hypothetical protein C0Q70_19805 [Pomacea canaliculata]
MCVQVTIEIDDVDMIYTDGRPNKMELVDTMSLLVTSQAPSAMYMYTPETLIGSRRGHPFRLKVAYRFDWDEHADDIILEDSAHITKTNTLLCPGATTSLATSSSSISIIDSSLRPATSSSVARSSTLSLPPSSPTDIKIQPTTTLHQTAELSTSSILETSFVLQMIISESSVMTERSAVTSGWTELIVETDFTSETSTKATQNSASDSPIHPTQSLKVDSSTEPSHFSMSSILFTEMSPTPTRDMSSNILAATSTSTEFKETSSFPSYTEVPDENGNKSSPVVMTESPDEPMKYWELILGCVLGGMALISLLGFLFYLRKQRAMLKRQEIYTVTPRLVSVVEENGTAGRSDIPSVILSSVTSMTQVEALRFILDLAYYDAGSQNDPDVQVSTDNFDGVPVKIFRPKAARSSSPAVVYFHGGGWMILSTDTYSEVTHLIAKTSNTIIVSVEYKLAPEHPYPRPFDDCLRATAHVLHNGEKYGINPKRVAVAGDSAGGNLAAAVALRLSQEDPDQTPPVKLQVLIYPVMQALDFNTYSYQTYSKTGILPMKLMVKMWMNYLGLSDAALISEFAANNHTSPLLKKVLPALE